MRPSSIALRRGRLFTAISPAPVSCRRSMVTTRQSWSSRPSSATLSQGGSLVMRGIRPFRPTRAVLGRTELQPDHPSEEHLPINVPPGAEIPAVGEHLYLVPRHVCPTVN